MLVLAICGNKTGSIDALVAAGANLELKDVEGCTALLVASATAGCEAAVEALLRNGADKEQVDGGGLTPLLVALEEGNEAAAAVLIEAGASLVGGHDDLRVLELAITGGSAHGGTSRGGGCVNIMRTLVERGVNVRYNDGGGSTALHWAAWHDDARAVDFLVEMGADVEARAYEDATPLHVAAQHAGNLSAIRALVRNGADIHARKSNGDTALHVAAGNCSFERSAATVDSLLRAGADESMVNAASETPADVLERKSDPNEEKVVTDCVAQVRKLLANAPADRACRVWARRRFVVMCRAFPDRVRLTGGSQSPSTGDSTTSPAKKKAATAEIGEGEPSECGQGATNGAPKRDTVFAHDFSGAMGSLMGFQAELFRSIVEFL